ncbi:hypothetical protein KCU99_g10184, partial [Aureobasidium melanogenum]
MATLTSPTSYADQSSLFLTRQSTDYTAGRWLRNDKGERKDRHISFDFKALVDKVISCCEGATSIQTWSKKEGNSCKAFVFCTDNGKQIVAKLPTSVAGPKSLITNSELATIRYLQKHTSVPIPRVIDWNHDPLNTVGCEYVIMEYAAGVPLSSVWQKLDLRKQMRCMESIVRHMAQLTKLDFPLYGSLYLSDFSMIDQSHKHGLNNDFCISLHCGNRFWACGADEQRFTHLSKPDHGPWVDIPAYYNGVIDTALTRLPLPDRSHPNEKLYQGRVEEHVQLLGIARKILQILAQDPRINGNASPTMMHPDLHLHNIFVDPDDPTTITAFIDWQGTSIEPAFEHAGMVLDIETTRHHFPGKCDSIEDSYMVLERAYDALVNVHVPRLAAVRNIDDDLLRLLRYCHRTWVDGITVLRDELINLST